MDLERRADSTFRKENLLRCHDVDDDSDDTRAMLKVMIFGKLVITSTVSWVRTRDSHIITVDDETFISDSRCLSSSYHQTKIS